MWISLLLGVAAASASSPKLRDLDTKISEEKASAARLHAQELDVLSTLAAAEAAVDATERSLASAEQKSRESQATLDAAILNEQQAQALLHKATETLAPRLRARQRMGHEGLMRFLVDAPTFAELLTRQRALDTLLKRDLELVTTLRAATDAARVSREKTAAAKTIVAAAVQDEAVRRASLDQKRATEAALLARIRNDKALHEAAARELEKARQELLRTLAGLPRSPPRKATFRALRGRLPWPTHGRIEVRFGKVEDPRLHTLSLQQGLDLRAPTGTPVVAIAPGKVVHAGWLHGYGNLLIVDQGDGYYTLFAHLATMARNVGDAVGEGDRLGDVGDTASLKGAYLYFEIRSGTQPQDPARWLGPRRF